MIFCELITGEYFVSTFDKIGEVEKEMNKILKIEDELYFNDFMKLLGLHERRWGWVYRWTNLGKPICEEKPVDIHFKEFIREDGEHYYLISYSSLPTSSI